MVFLDQIMMDLASSFHYSIGFKINQVLQDVSTSMGSFINIPKKVFAAKNKEIAQKRLQFFNSIPPLRKMRKEIYYDDNTFEKLHNEWGFWQKQNKFRPPKSFQKRFPQRLTICPMCEGKPHVIQFCECINSFWLLRLFHISAQPCDCCRGTGEIAVRCNHCNGKKKRIFV